MDNGIVQVNLSNPGGMVTGIQYNGIDNLLEVINNETDRGWAFQKFKKKKKKKKEIPATSLLFVEEHDCDTWRVI